MKKQIKPKDQKKPLGLKGPLPAKNKKKVNEIPATKTGKKG